MAILKCKMCGGDIVLSEDRTFGTCDHCGSTMTFPKVSDEQKLNLYNRANHFRRQNEFDKAIAAYDRILDQDDTDAEAHWGAVLSRYGIEYVEDPASHERIPTCHRVQAASILGDSDYLSALEYAPDHGSRTLYEQEARRIAEIQKGILAISDREKPYDVFICYKETDEAGQRTRDSALAQDVYYQLVNEGYKVFFSRITLEDKLGREYEPYIFAALNSAKVMLVIGTRPEFFSAVWVKNEWSRYLTLMKNDRSRLLIPCYRDMDPYDLPEELSALQSQDMGRIGFIQDIVRGIKKVLTKPEQQAQPAVVQQAPAAAASVENLMKRARLFLEDGDLASANEYLDKVLDTDAEYAPAYAARVCADLGFRREEQLAEATFLYGDHPDWKKALRFASPQQKAVYEGWYEKVQARVEKQIRDYAYDCAVEMAVRPGSDRKKLDAELEAYKADCGRSAGSRPDGSRRKDAEKYEEAFLRAAADNDPGDVPEEAYKAAAEMFRAIGDAKADEQAESCLALAEQARQKKIYQAAMRIYTPMAYDLDKKAELLESIPEYRDAKQQAENSREQAEKRRAELYGKARKAMEQASVAKDKEKWQDAKTALDTRELNEYKDVAELRKQADRYKKECEEAEERAKLLAEKAAAAKRKRTKILLTLLVILAVGAFIGVTKIILPKNHYDQGIALRASGQWDAAVAEFEQAGSYSGAKTQITETVYQQAASLNKAGKYAEAYELYTGISGYKDVDSIMKTDKNIAAAAAAAAAREAKIAPFKKTGGYVTYGQYPQTSSGTDSTPIEWLVLDHDAKNNRTLLISRYGLDAKPYNEKYTDITWEQCTLRTWLNETFINKAFSAEERSAIRLTKVDNSSGQGYSGWSTSGGKDTQDRIFLLSYAEANRYFGVTNSDSNNTGSRVHPTDYAIKQGAYTSGSNKTAEGKAAGWWWLRSPGSDLYYAAGVGLDGSLGYNYVSAEVGPVRPAFWLDLSSDIF